MEGFWERIEADSLSGKGIRAEDALSVLGLPQVEIWRLLAVSEKVRRRFKGDQIRLCSIVNAKSGLCSEDCAFCSQSIRSKASIDKYPLMEEEDLVMAARDAKQRGAREFSIVTSGLSMHSNHELDRVGKAIARIGTEVGIETCVSLGALSAENISFLLSRGLRSVHHNLETARGFFPSICTTHDYEEDVRAVREAKAAGAWVCCGGIFGIGETDADRVDLAMTLRELDVDSIPVNFLNPIEGTPLHGKSELTPFGCLKIIVMMRLCHPLRELIVCGGREVNLRDLQGLIFAAGASGMMIGNYLTTSGRPAEDDLRMVEDLGLGVRPL
ncbi:MAG: biotin synthase BioB [Proteobacteria bacterium]|nr:biotin synthase BioB [Pseudomonadota bacterium]MBU4581130.1 biotin synthase BioB [Pseudomonadota bacterium]MCG2742237.1 biotin synthase BioB [Syntrophaceae bacterium]